MSRISLFQRLTVALSIAIISSPFVTAISSAEVINPPSSPQVVRVETPRSGARIHGNVTVTGLAVDCGTGQAATRVAVYDGPNANGPYIADVSIDTVRSLLVACARVVGSGQIGFTLIFDSNRLADGRHTLTFVAEYPNGTAQTTSISVTVDNFAEPVYGYPVANGISYGGYYYNGVYTPSYTRCTGFNALGQCVGYQIVSGPVVTPALYPGCITTVYGNCVAYPYLNGLYNPSYAATYLSGLYYWNGAAWVRR